MGPTGVTLQAPRQKELDVILTALLTVSLAAATTADMQDADAQARAHEPVAEEADARTAIGHEARAGDPRTARQRLVDFRGPRAEGAAMVASNPRADVDVLQPGPRPEVRAPGPRGGFVPLSAPPRRTSP